MVDAIAVQTSDYTDGRETNVVETEGIKPSTLCLQSRCSIN